MQRIIHTIKAYQMIQPGMRVLAAVSGGADSVCLLVTLAGYRSQMDFSLSVVHVEHGLRGEESLEDAQYVRKLCEALKVPFYLESVDAKRVAKELGYLYVDTGAIYRTVGYHMWLMGIGPKDADGIRRCLDDVNIEIRHEEDGVQHMILNGQDVTGEIRTPEMSRYASGVSAQKCVREYLLDMQRRFSRKHNVVMDGRDIGTVVLPNAQVKIFLTASPEERAKRRYEELTQKGEKVSYEKVLQDMIARDKQDSERAIAPLRPAPDAVRLDTSGNTIEQSIAEILAIVRRKLG